ncbi:hypothetical protein [Haloprofundus halophilus]|uniref:hypothetical protein n=1 Tax=Haloprofundus halophilus TaxID=2283527 RepID=UPI000E4515E4|nr:hypothetical protein [Haloprofundus halophilus]
MPAASESTLLFNVRRALAAVVLPLFVLSLFGRLTATATLSALWDPTVALTFILIAVGLWSTAERRSPAVVVGTVALVTFAVTTLVEYAGLSAATARGFDTLVLVSGLVGLGAYVRVLWNESSMAV